MEKYFIWQEGLKVGVNLRNDFYITYKISMKRAISRMNRIFK